MYLEYIYGNEDEDIEDDNPYADCFKYEKKKEIYMNGDDYDEYDNCAPGFYLDKDEKRYLNEWDDGNNYYSFKAKR